MTEKIKLVAGDTKPQVKVVIKDDDTGLPMNVAGATVRLLFRAAGSATLQATVNGTLLTGLENEDGSITTTAPYDTPGAGGRVAFVWAAGNLDAPAGDYEGEIKVTFSDGSKQTVYDILKFKLREDFGD